MKRLIVYHPDYREQAEMVALSLYNQGVGFELRESSFCPRFDLEGRPAIWVLDSEADTSFLDRPLWQPPARAGSYHQ
jgi:hypothetical protein